MDRVAREGEGLIWTRIWGRGRSLLKLPTVFIRNISDLERAERAPCFLRFWWLGGQQIATFSSWEIGRVWILTQNSEHFIFPARKYAHMLSSSLLSKCGGVTLVLQRLATPSRSRAQNWRMKMFLYFWRDKFWSVAVAKEKGKKISETLYVRCTYFGCPLPVFPSLFFTCVHMTIARSSQRVRISIETLHNANDTNSPTTHSSPNS